MHDLAGVSGGRPVPGARLQHLLVHRVFRGLDDLFHHRRQDQTGSGAVGDRVRHPGGHAGPDRVGQPHLSRRLDRAVWRAPGLHDPDAGHRRGVLAALRGPDLRGVPPRRARRRAGRRVVHRRHRLHLAMVREGTPGHRARHLRGRQCGRSADQFRRAIPGDRLRLGADRADLRGRAGADRNRVLPAGQAGPRGGGAQAGGPQAGLRPGTARAARQPAGLALRHLLLLRVRRLRRARLLPAALLCRRLRPVARHRRHAGGGLFDARINFSCARRLDVGQMGRAVGHVSDLPRVAGLPVRDELSAHPVHRAGHRRPRGSSPSASPCRSSSCSACCSAS